MRRFLAIHAVVPTVALVIILMAAGTEAEKQDIARSSLLQQSGTNSDPFLMTAFMFAEEIVVDNLT